MLDPNPHRIRRFHRSGRPPVATNLADDLRFIRDTIPLPLLQALSTRAGGEVAEVP